MRFRMTVDVEGFPRGKIIEVPPFGGIPNGSSREVNIPGDDIEQYERSAHITLEPLPRVRVDRLKGKRSNTGGEN